MGVVEVFADWWLSKVIPYKVRQWVPWFTPIQLPMTMGLMLPSTLYRYWQQRHAITNLRQLGYFSNGINALIFPLWEESNVHCCNWAIWVMRPPIIWLQWYYFHFDENFAICYTITDSVVEMIRIIYSYIHLHIKEREYSETEIVPKQVKSRVADAIVAKGKCIFMKIADRSNSHTGDKLWDIKFANKLTSTTYNVYSTAVPVMKSYKTSNGTCIRPLICSGSYIT